MHIKSIISSSSELGHKFLIFAYLPKQCPDHNDQSTTTSHKHIKPEAYFELRDLNSFQQTCTTFSEKLLHLRTLTGKRITSYCSKDMFLTSDALQVYRRVQSGIPSVSFPELIFDPKNIVKNTTESCEHL